jgi:signal transduction histidine kinase
VEKIQEISQGEDGTVELNKEEISLLPFFTKLKKQFESLGEKNIFIQLQIEENIPFMSDILHFSNIMENLTENSIKYSGEDVSIEIKAFRKDDHLHVIHRDNGWGISDSEIPRIFDKFYRGRSAEKQRKSGFGLGLSYVKIMIEKMGGNITVSSKEKQFTEFTVILPL